MNIKQILAAGLCLAALAGCATDEATLPPGEARACQVLLDANPTAGQILVGVDSQLRSDAVYGDPLLVCMPPDGEKQRDGQWWAMFPDKAAVKRLVASAPGSAVTLPPGAVEGNLDD